MEGKIAEQRKNMGGTHKSTSKHNALSKCTTGLENRLYEVRGFYSIKVFH